MMEDNFKDIFETIDSLHKKYSSKEYLENLENFNKNSNDLMKILEKYKVNQNKGKSIKIRKNEGKVKYTEKSRKNYLKNNNLKSNTDMI